MGSQRAIGRDDRPAIREHADVAAAEREHRLDREAHPGPELGAAVAGPVVRDLRLLVHVAADPVADEVPDDAVAVRLRDVLDRSPDVGDVVAGQRGGDAGHHAEAGGIHQLPDRGLDLADDERPGAVAVPAVDDRADIDRDELASLDRAVAGDPMDHFFVDGDACRSGKGSRAASVAAAAEIALERRDPARRADVALGEAVELGGRDTRLQLRLDEGEDFGDDPPGPAHPVDLVGSPDHAWSPARARDTAAISDALTASIGWRPSMTWSRPRLR